MLDNWVLALTLIVSLILGFTVLGTFIWGAKTGQFDDEDKVMNGLLFDSEEDLQEAVKRENQRNDLIKNKKENNDKDV
jgi:cbb3-type cytochrome oxidase maturation protein